MAAFSVMAVLLAALCAGAQPSEYSIKKLPAGSAPVIDGNITEWPAEYFIDSLHSDSNVYARDGDIPWTPAEFQLYLYAAYDDDKVYFGAKVTQDDSYVIGDGWDADNMKIDPGGQAAAFYINSDGSGITINPSSPYTLDSTLWAVSLTYGNGSLPTYEFAWSRTVQAPYTEGVFRASIGSEDTDSGMLQYFCVIGISYGGDKNNWSCSNCPWLNPYFNPEYTLIETEGPSVRSEQQVQGGLSEDYLCVSPNPFWPATTLSYRLRNSGRLRIYDLSGRLIKSFQVNGPGRVVWDGKKNASGLYLARLVSGKTVLNTRLFLTR